MSKTNDELELEINKLKRSINYIKHNLSADVTSIFGRTGVVVAANNDYTFAQLASKPTTLAGYGITDAKVNAALTVYGLLGGTIKAEPIFGNLTNLTTSYTLADNTTIYTAVYLPVAATITGVAWVQGIAGNYTADNYNGVGLYTYSAGNITKVASSTDDGNIWKGTVSTFQTKNFSATYAATAGLYYIGILYNNSAQVTAPTVSAISSTSSTGAKSADFTNSAKLAASHAAQNTLAAGPVSFVGLSVIANSPYFALY